MLKRYRLFGADAQSWLQGQVTQDVMNLSELPGKWFALCTPTGHIQCAGIVWTEDETLFLAVDAEAAEILEHRVRTHVILEEVELEYLGNGFFCEGWRVTSFPQGAWKPNLIFRGGFPLAGKDYDGKVLCSELGEAFLRRAVSFTKGCYPGQEVIQRIKTRGHTNRTWRALKTSRTTNPGEVVRLRNEPVGVVLRQPDFDFASALIRNSVEPGTEVMLGEFPATVWAIPLF